jgi:type IV pilus assembly protein PilW
MNGPTRNRSGQGGFSLVELMVSMTLGLVILAGLATILLANRTTYRVQNSASRIQEDGRFALSTMARDLRMADFWGCPGMEGVTNHLDTSGTGFVDFVALGGIDGIENDSDPDAITIVGAADSLRVVTPFMPTTAANIKVTSPNDLQVGDVVLVSDCTAGDIFQISSGSPGTTGTVVHNTGGVVTPGNATGDLSQVYRDDAQLYRIRSVGYAVAAGANGDPALFRSVDGVAEEIVADIGDLQLLYGEDSDGDGGADRYRDADTVAMDEVVSVRLQLTLLGEPGSGSDGGRLQKSFATTVALRNRIP